MTSHIDWYEVTLPDAHDWPLTELVPLGERQEWSELDRGKMGYGRARRNPYGALWLGAPAMPNMGTHIVMPGRACAAYVALTGDAWFVRLTRYYQALGGHVTRIDFALDDTSGWLTPTRLLLGDKAGNVTRRTPNPPTWQGSAGYGMGTATWGARGSGAFVRCYDKAAEQAGKDGGKERFAALTPWVRLEYEFRGDTARTLGEHLAARGQDALSVYALRTLALRCPNPGDTNRSRWDIEPTFAKLVGTGSPLRAALPTATGTIAERRAWVERVAARALAAIRETMDGQEFAVWIWKVCDDGRRRMTVLDWEQVRTETGEARIDAPGLTEALH
jgi:hypothetical protein